MSNSFKKLINSVDLEGFDKKNINLVEHNKEKLSAEIRYLFKWLILPLEIQDIAKNLRRNHTSQEEFVPIKIGEHDFNIELINDHERGKYWKITEFQRWENKYRSVPYNWDVYNHLHHQHPFYEEYVESLVSAWIISELYWRLLVLYHRIHDVPEAVNWDDFVDDKTSENAEEEAKVIIDQINDSWIYYTEKEKELAATLFQIFEWNEIVFKPWEIVNYWNDSINSRYDNNYLNSKKIFSLDVQAAVLAKIANNTVIIPPVLWWEKREFSLSTLPFAQKYLKKNSSIIERMIDYWNNEIKNFDLSEIDMFGVDHTLQKNHKLDLIKWKLIEFQKNFNTLSSV